MISVLAVNFSKLLFKNIVLSLSMRVL